MMSGLRLVPVDLNPLCFVFLSLFQLSLSIIMIDSDKK